MTRRKYGKIRRVVMRLIFKSSLLLCTTLCIFAEQTIPPAEAAKHVGEKATRLWSRCQRPLC